jgi:hypothetical protein
VALSKVVKLEPKERTPAVQCRRRQSPLNPELKEFIDRVIVPILVKEYLAITDAENGLAEKDSDAAHSVRSTAAQELRAVRP